MQLDADLVHNPNDLVLMYNEMIENNLDLVILWLHEAIVESGAKPIF